MSWTEHWRPYVTWHAERATEQDKRDVDTLVGSLCRQIAELEARQLAECRKQRDRVVTALTALLYALDDAGELENYGSAWEEACNALAAAKEE